jgi:hypothetical protein
MRGKYLDQDPGLFEIKETTTLNDVKLIGISDIEPAIGVKMFYSATAFSLKKCSYFGIPIIEKPGGGQGKRKERFRTRLLPFPAGTQSNSELR